MAVYKVIQDVEAEDKLLGPLTLKSFIYAAIAALCGFIEFKLLTIGTPLKFLFILMFLPPMVLFGVLASPLGREQPTEVWLLSRLRFYLKPHRRIWDQDGQQELVTVTAPQKIDPHLTKDLNQTEVQSRLKTLAATLDTRGWAIKNADVNVGTAEAAVGAIQSSDRLVGHAEVPSDIYPAVVKASDDIMDEKHNPTAQKFQAMMLEAEAERKHGILSALRDLSGEHKPDQAKAKHKKTRKGAHRPGVTGAKDLPAVKTALKTLRKETAAEKAKREAEEKAVLDAKLAKARTEFSAEFSHGQVNPNPHHHVVGMRVAARPAPPPPQPSPVTTAAQAVNMELAQSGSAFSVATVSKLANRQPQVQQNGPNEVTISLH